jgi:hypothetical protein
MNGSFKIAVAAVAIAIAGCATRSTTGYAIVFDGAIAMEKVRREGIATYPWIDPSETVIWACDWAKITYNEVPLLIPADSYAEARKQRAAYFYLTGEWCQVAKALLEANHRVQHVVFFRQWERKKYLLSWTRLYHDNDNHEYIAEKAFVDLLDLQPLLRDIKQGNENSGCFWSVDPDLEEIKAREVLVPYGEDFCFSKGVYLRDLVTAHNKSIQTSRPKQRASVR